jgi:hypothetical protein
MCLNYRMGRFADFIRKHQFDLHKYANSGNEEVKQILETLRKAAKWEMRAASGRSEITEKADAINNGNEAITQYTEHYIKKQGGTRRTRRTRRNKRKRTRKNKTTRRYKKMKGGENGLITNEKELKKSFDNKKIGIWEADDGQGNRKRFFREDITYDELKKSLEYYFEQMDKRAGKQKIPEDEKGYIKEFYY